MSTSVAIQTRTQCDEIWSFIYSKEKNLPEDLRGQFGIGNIWTWVALDSDSKLAISWLVGNRDADYAKVFMQERTLHRVSRTAYSSRQTA